MSVSLSVLNDFRESHLLNHSIDLVDMWTDIRHMWKFLMQFASSCLDKLSYLMTGPIVFSHTADSRYLDLTYLE